MISSFSSVTAAPETQVVCEPACITLHTPSAPRGASPLPAGGILSASCLNHVVVVSKPLQRNQSLIPGSTPVSISFSTHTFQITHLRRRPDRPHHPLQQLHSCLLPRLPHADAHVLQQRWVADVRGQRVARDVRCPLVLGRVCGADADKARLEGLELLLGAELVGHGVWCMWMCGWAAGCWKGCR